VRRTLLAALASAFVAAAVLIGCQDDEGPPTAPISQPSPAIMDAAHDGLYDYFYLLPPMVPEPLYDGVFDPSRSPEVEIVEWKDGTWQRIILFTMSEGAGSERVRVSMEDEHYIVNWHTDDWGPTHEDNPVRIRVLDGLRELGFADVILLQKGEKAKNLATGEDVILKDGRTLPIKFRIEEFCDCLEATVDSDGGEFVVDTRWAAVIVPEDAVDGEVHLTIEPVPVEVQGGEIVGPLPTDLDQWPLYYRITADGDFTKDVRVEVCQVDDELGGDYYPPVAIHNRLRLGHEIEGENRIEVLAPDGPPAAINCDGVGEDIVPVLPSVGQGPAYHKSLGSRLVDAGLDLLRRLEPLAEQLTPAPAHAVAVEHVGLTGRLKSFSVIGAVDPASISGTISAGDDEPVPVEGVTVSLVYPDETTEDFVTGDDGTYTFSDLPDLTYTVEITQKPDGYDDVPFDAVSEDCDPSGESATCIIDETEYLTVDFVGQFCDCLDATVDDQGGDFVIDTRRAAISVPPGAVPDGEQVIITIERVPVEVDGAGEIVGPLPTLLDQWPLYYRITADQDFLAEVTVEVCQVDDEVGGDFYPPLAIHDRLRLGHEIEGENRIEVLAPAGAPALIDCTDAGLDIVPVVIPSLNGSPSMAGASSFGSKLAKAGLKVLSGLEPLAELVTPPSAHAVAVEHVGLTGRLKSFSLVGAVDPGTISGVLSAGNEPVAGATVTMEFPDQSSIQLITDEDGGYAFTDLADLTYTVRVTQAPGYEDFIFLAVSEDCDPFRATAVCTINATEYLIVDFEGSLAGPLLFISNRDELTYTDIFVMDADGTNSINLTNSAGVIERNPAWSPDRSRIVFERGELAAAEIWVMDVNGSNQMQLTNNSSFDGYPAWSPDGNKIAFTSRANGGYYEIWVMDSDGSNPGQLTDTNTGGGNLRPDWRPDGLKIAFDSGRDGGEFELYIMDADGSNQTRLTTNTVPDWKPVWSPSGTSIAFERRDPDLNIDLWVYDMIEPTEFRLTTNQAVDADPTWSPDGLWVAFASNRTSDWDVFKIKVDDSTIVNLTDTSVFDREPAWQQ